MPEITVPRPVHYQEGRFYVETSEGVMTAIDAPGGGGGGGEVPPDLIATIADLQRRIPVHVDMSEAGLEWRQNSALVGGVVVSNLSIPYNTPQFPRATLKKVVQFQHVADGLSFLNALFIFGPQIASILPETPPNGGEWEFRLPGVLLRVEGMGDEALMEDDRFRGYARGLAYAHSANHNYTIYGAAEIRTYGADLSEGWVACRFDWSEFDQPGVCNKRNPLYHNEMWHDGSYLGFTLNYPTE